MKSVHQQWASASVGRLLRDLQGQEPSSACIAVADGSGKNDPSASTPSPSPKSGSGDASWVGDVADISRKISNTNSPASGGGGIINTPPPRGGGNSGNSGGGKMAKKEIGGVAKIIIGLCTLALIAMSGQGLLAFLDSRNMEMLRKVNEQETQSLAVQKQKFELEAQINAIKNGSDPAVGRVKTLQEEKIPTSSCPNFSGAQAITSPGHYVIEEGCALVVFPKGMTTTVSGSGYWIYTQSASGATGCTNGAEGKNVDCAQFVKGLASSGVPAHVHVLSGKAVRFTIRKE